MFLILSVTWINMDKYCKYNVLNQMWEYPQIPFLLQLMIDPLVNTYPKIAFGLPITEMEPLAKPIDMEGT